MSAQEVNPERSGFDRATVYGTRPTENSTFDATRGVRCVASDENDRNSPWRRQPRLNPISDNRNDRTIDRGQQTT
jgi:hypothetical protein